MLKITKVKRNSIAKQLGLEIGDEITSFNNHPAEDELDYLYYCTLETFSITVKDKRSGVETTVEIEKDEDEDLGVEFEKNTAIRTCQNRCVFCFVDQMPKGMRESLYVKDDDYGMSFTCGNFVTLTNLSDAGLERIIRLKLSPLYISVHTMNGELRKKLLNNRFADKLVHQIDALAKGGVTMHCQAVLVPNLNDGEELVYTARELFKYYPAVQDIACVPTGITKYREGLYSIPDVDKAYSEKLLDTVAALNKEFGVNFLLPADEYFIKAERPFPPASFYGEFEQIENGIGLSTKFHAEFLSALERLPATKNGKTLLKKPKRSLLISGVSAEKINKTLCALAEEKIEGLQTEVLPVVNSFFGETVTCTGLLTGTDILHAIREYCKDPTHVFDEIILAGNTMKEFEDVFLCGMTKKEFEKQLNFCCVRVNRGGGAGLVELLATNK